MPSRVPPSFSNTSSCGSFDPDQVWVWTDEWQAKLNASLGDLQTGGVKQFERGEELLEAL